jgi:uncharacterized protein (TIGR03435 family)
MRPSLLLCAITTVAAWGQQPSRPEFEVATIRPSAPSPEATVTAGARIDGAQVRWASYTLKRYMATAYRVKLDQIAGPDWISSDRFDISATIPAGVSTTQMPEMMQRLIEDRFQVKMHREKKDFPVYALEVAKGGLKMLVNAPDPDAAKADANTPVNTNVSGSAQGVSINFGRGSSYTFANNRFEAKKLTMANLARGLELYTDRPIVDRTDLTGTYDFTLEITAEDYQAMLVRAAVTAGLTLPPEALRLLDGASLPSLFDAMQKVGLKLDARKAPLDVLVIDEARKTPTDN